MPALPRWMMTVANDLRSFDWHVKSGWIALHSAALYGGNAAAFRARHSTESDSLQVRPTQYRSLVFDIPRRTGFGDEILGRAWTQTATKIGQMLASKVGNDLRVHQETDSVSIGEFINDTRNELTRALPTISFLVSTPFDALKSAYKVLRQGRAAKSVRPIDLYCLAWISIAAHGILRMRHCDVCFRWAIPGHLHCYEHSQSKEAPGTSQEKSRRYRTAAKIAVTFHHPPRSLPKHSIMCARRLPQIMARLIWRTPLPNEERTVRSIKEALAKRPMALAQIGTDALSLTSVALYKRLEDRIDPLEINPSAWVWKIKQMDRWEREKTTRCPGQRGKGHATRSRIIEAISLAEEGNPKSMIAEILGVHPSTISNWIRRAPYPGLVDTLKLKFRKK